jgi:Tfp pilus assembly protein PilO
MNQKVSPKVFFAVLAMVVLVMGFLLYRQATEPLYHHEPTEEEAMRQFAKPEMGKEAQTAPKGNTPNATKPAPPSSEKDRAPQ